LAVEAGRTGISAVVDCAHGLVATVSGKLDLVIFNYILLKNGLPVLALQTRLLECLRIEITLRDKSVVAGNVGSSLSSSHGQLVHLIGLLCGVSRQKVARVVPILAERVGVFGLVICAL
jgi:hypothetical protein